MNKARARFFCFTCTVVVVCASCFDNSDPVDKAAATAIVTGTWTGSTSVGELVSMTLNQFGTTVDGSVRIGNVSGNLTGTVDGTRLEATIQSSPPRLIFATVSGASTSSDPNADSVMSGTVRDITGAILSNFDAQRR